VQGASYLWQGPNGFVSTLQNPAPFPAIPSLSGVYSLVAISGNCTSSVATTAVQVSPRPARPIVNAPRAVCQNGELQITAFGELGVAYYWSGPGNFTATTQGVTPPVNNLQGTQVYSVVAIANGCTSVPASVSVEVMLAPQDLAVSSNTPVCEGSSLLLTASASGAATYTWQGPGGFTSTLASLQIDNAKATNAGVYTVTAQINGCSVERTLAVDIYPQPSAIITAQKNVTCSLGEIQFMAQNGQDLLYSINNGPFNNTSGLFTNLAAGNYLVRFTNGQCTTAVPVSILDNSAPSITQAQATLQTHSMISVSWGAVSGAIGYNLAYRKAGSNEPWFTINDISSTNYVVTNLASNTVYEFKVQSICGVRAFSAFSPERTGVTDREPGGQNCTSPSGLSVELVSSSGARVLWNPVLSGVTCYVVSYGPLTASPDSWATLLVPHPSSSLLLENLQPGVTYGVTVRSNCTNCSALNGTLSGWVTPRVFTAPNAKEAAAALADNFETLIYPNPTTGISSLSVKTSDTQNRIIIEVFTATGALIYHNSMEPTSTVIHENLNLEGNSAGVYWVKIRQADYQQNVKLILR
jgi:hypothetical protein